MPSSSANAIARLSMLLTFSNLRVKSNACYYLAMIFQIIDRLNDIIDVYLENNLGEDRN